MKGVGESNIGQKRKSDSNASPQQLGALQIAHMIASYGTEKACNCTLSSDVGYPRKDVI